MSLAFTPRLGFTIKGNFVENIEAKSLFAKTLDVEGGISFNGSETVTGNLTVNGNTTLGNAPADTLTVVATSTFQNAVTIGDSLLDVFTVNGTSFFNGAIATPNATAGIFWTGTVENPSVDAAGGTLAAIPGASRTLNGRVGRLKFTNVASLASGGTDTLTILNNRGNTSGLVTLETPVIANDSFPVITNVVWNVGVSIVVTIENKSATATGVGAYNFTFIAFN